jgi:hypothetical protein
MVARIDVYRSSAIAPSYNTGLISIFTKTYIAGGDLEMINTPPVDELGVLKCKVFIRLKSSI